MHELYELKDMLYRELEEYGKKGELSAGTLDIVDKLAHALKNLNKIVEEDEYSGRTYRRSYNDGMTYSRRRYSRDGDMVSRLRELMNDAPDDRSRQEIQRLISKME